MSEAVLIIQISQADLAAMIAKGVADGVAKAKVESNDGSKEIITRKQLMERLDITEPTVIRMERKKTIPFMKVGSIVRYDWNAVLKALEKKTA